MRTDLSDEQLVKLSLQNVENFGILIQRYETKLIRYILRLSNIPKQEAEEILQEVFLKTWRNMNNFDLDLKFSNWIYRITHNETISHFRKRTQRGEDKTDDIENLFDLKSTELSIPEQIDRKQRAITLRKSLRTLPEKYREVLILRYFENKSYDEISDILKKPSGTVATLLNRAKTALKQSYISQNTNQQHFSATESVRYLKIPMRQPLIMNN